MASGSQGPKQTRGYFVPVGRCDNKVLQYSGGAGAGGSFLPGSFTAATWVASDARVSTINGVGAGGLLRDMGKTVVSSNRTFRKVQLIAPSAVGAAGVVGVHTTSGPYLTAYIELATGNALVTDAVPAPVAYLPGLL
jgi:hypothetical protein